jgi:selenocysteine-specific elongation factor
VNQLILGTAGHIDHGKTALVHALTGTDTDRLKEEKSRGITIELGFAELSLGNQRLGVVDVPGHEAFVRSMVAGATGMDLVLLIIAADEGVMPQTKEHLIILELLGVQELVVTLTKSDLVDDEWRELVRSDVEELLTDTPYAGAPVVFTSTINGEGLDALVEELAETVQRIGQRDNDDLARLPLDRVFTIQGTGTVVTGTLWTGTLRKGEHVRLLPNEFESRVRKLQVHGSDVERATAGNRIAVALSGASSDRQTVTRGATLVSDANWKSSWMITAHVQLIQGTKWTLKHNQRIRVHIGTSEVMARCALLTKQEICSGAQGWIQLRLEEPVVARARDRIILRAYSPMTTIGGGIVAEPQPVKRNFLAKSVREALEKVLEGEPIAAVEALLLIASWYGIDTNAIPITSGLPPGIARDAVTQVQAGGGLQTSDRLFSREIALEAEGLILRAVQHGHIEKPLRSTIPLPILRSSLPTWAAPEIADAVIGKLTEEGALERQGSGVKNHGYQPHLSPRQEQLVAELRDIYTTMGLAAPLVGELPPHLARHPDVWGLLKFLEENEELVGIADGYYVLKNEFEAAIQRVRNLLGGQAKLGPSAFREALPLSRKQLIPMLNYLDGLGVTVRHDDGREVPLPQT